MNTPNQSLNLEQALAILRRWKWLGVLVALAAGTLTMSTIVFLPNVYESSATILIERQQVPEDFVRSTVTRQVDSRLQEIGQRIMSRSRLLALIDRFGLYAELKGHARPDEIVELMRRDIRLVLKGVTQTGAGGAATVAFTVSYRGRSPERVTLVTNALASFYIEEDLKVRERQAAGTAEFLRGQLEEMKKKLEQQERLVKDFKERYMGELPQQEAANLATLERLTAELLLNSEKQALARQRVALLARGVGEAGDPGLTDPDTIDARLARAKRDLASLKKQFTDKYPDVVSLRSEIEALQRQLPEAKENDTAEGEHPLRARPDGGQGSLAAGSMNAELLALRNEESNLKKRIAEYQSRVENTPRREQEFQALQRDYDTTQEMYRTLLKRYEEAQLAESLEQKQKGEQFRILDPAVPAERPIAPKRARLVFLGLALSLGLAGAAVALAATFDTSFHAADELRGFSKVPVLVTIQRIVTKTDRRLRARRLWLGAASAIVGCLLIVAATYVLARENAWLAQLLS